MDFLDPKKQRRHAVVLLFGYACIAVAILLATIVLLELAWGYRRDKNGDVVQYGSLFVSSEPSGAAITLNKIPAQKNTNTRISLVSGQYVLQLSKAGYRTWQQTVDIEGDAIRRSDYPFLFPETLKTTPVANANYASLPGTAIQSPDQRWLLVQRPGSDTTFDEYDLKNPKDAAVAVALPANVVTDGTTQTYEQIAWADDNEHVLLKHTYNAGNTEYILLDRADPDQSINLTKTLNLNPTETLSLINKKYDQYYLFDTTAQTLQSASISNPTATPVLNHVLAYQSYGTNMLLYASSQNAATGKVVIDLLQGGKTYALRQVAASTTYLLNLAQYSGSWYVTLGASSEGKVYVYKDPADQLNSKYATLAPIYVLRTENLPSYVSVSPNARFMMIESGSQFALFDAEYDVGYRYDTKLPLDAPQLHASWMDGNHLEYISGGKLVVFDFDHGNEQTLMAANPNYQPFFDPSYHFVDTIVPGTTTGPQATLTTTALLTLADQ